MGYTAQGSFAQGEVGRQIEALAEAKKLLDKNKFVEGKEKVAKVITQLQKVVIALDEHAVSMKN